MLSEGQCRQRVKDIDEELVGLQAMRDAKHAAVERWYREKREAKVYKQQKLIMEAERLAAERGRAARPYGPFVVCQDVRVLCTDGTFRDSPDAALLCRYSYRGNAERAALEFVEPCTIETLTAYYESQEQRRQQRKAAAATAADIGPEPPMPGDDATLADYNKWEQDHKVWSQKKFAAGLK